MRQSRGEEQPPPLCSEASNLRQGRAPPAGMQHLQVRLHNTAVLLSVGPAIRQFSRRLGKLSQSATARNLLLQTVAEERSHKGFAGTNGACPLQLLNCLIVVAQSASYQRAAERQARGCLVRHRRKLARSIGRAALDKRGDAKLETGGAVSWINLKHLLIQLSCCCAVLCHSSALQ
eukprot:m.139318 g.139318  ORF g.139318 m.139318 type:complete len:176 (-) comp9989_c0_seq8:133-660(-)